MNEHAQSLVHPHVKIEVAEYRTSITVLDITDFKRHTLLVLLDDLCTAVHQLTFDIGRQYIWNRRTPAVLFKVHGIYIERGFIVLVNRHIVANVVQREWESTPFASNQFKACKSHNDRILEISNKHSEESNRAEVGDSAHFLFWLEDRNLELDPTGRT